MPVPACRVVMVLLRLKGGEVLGVGGELMLWPHRLFQVGFPVESVTGSGSKGEDLV